MKRDLVPGVIMPPQKKIAIVGKAPDSMLLAPYKDPEWQIWGLNDQAGLNTVPRVDTVFEMHPHDFATMFPEEHKWMMQNTTVPIFMREANPMYPRSIAYPKDIVIKEFGQYITNTVSWMLALAILMEPDEIGLWGVNMAQSLEYASQRPSCEYFIGVAIGRGIKVTIPEVSDLMKTAGLYGFDEHVNAMWVKWDARRKELKGKVAGLQQEIQQKTMECTYLQGALEDCEMYWGQWFQDPSGRKSATEYLATNIPADSPEKAMQMLASMQQASGTSILPLAFSMLAATTTASTAMST